MRRSHHTRKAKRHTRLRKSKTRVNRRRQRRQRGGAYSAQQLVDFLQAVPNYDESQIMFQNMVRPCIHPDYPRYAETINPNRKHYTALISAFQAGANAEDNLKRNMIFIDVTANADVFLGATITIIPVADLHASPALWREHIGAALYGRSIVNELFDDQIQRATHRPPYEALLAALAEVYKQPNEEMGVHEC